MEWCKIKFFIFGWISKWTQHRQTTVQDFLLRNCSHGLCNIVNTYCVIMQSSIIYKFYWFDLSIFVLSKNISCTMFVGGLCLIYVIRRFVWWSALWFLHKKNDVGWSLPQLFVKVLLSNLCYLRLFAHSDVNYDLSIWVKWRVSHKKCMGSLQVFSEVHVAHLFSFL
jgi:hypothetical protein